MKRFLSITAILISFFTLFPKTEIAGYPFAGYSNETGFYGGVLGYFRHQASLSDSIKNVLYCSSAYSQKKQFSFLVQPSLRLNNGLYELLAELEYERWPSQFYGIGMNNRRSDAEKFTFEEKKMVLYFSRLLTKIWKLSYIYEGWHFDLVKTEADGNLINLADNSRKLSSGLGFALDLDSRNTRSYPASGSLYGLKIINFSHFLGSDHTFIRLTLNLRNYHQLNHQHTLAIQAYFSGISGEVPFYLMNRLNSGMRAITSNLYIDRQIFILRLEDRFFPWDAGLKKRLGMVFFTELGEVAPEISKFNLPQMQLNYGIGFRYSFFLDDRLNVRIDIGFGEIKANISIATGEVF